jgi:hypothetical protein
MQTFTVPDTSAVLELRQYTHHPGGRDTLIDLFERVFLEPQEAMGMRVLGQFRDLDDADRFVWLRGFSDLASRAGCLDAFYTSAVWKAHRDAANATLIDSDNVLLLRPVDAASGFLLPAGRPPATAAAATIAAATTTAATAATPARGFVLATVYLLRAPADDEFVRWFDARVAPVMAATGAPPLARFRTEYARNDYPRLPVREGEHAFVWFSSVAGPAEHERHRAELARSAAWKAIEPELAARFAAPPQQLRLAPTARSRLRHVEPIGYTTRRTGDVHDFDFLVGEWSVVNRRLAARGVGCTEWDEFPGVSRVVQHLGGMVNVDEITFPARGWSGLTVRTFLLAERQWSIHWVSSRTGAIDAGVVGGFAGDHGEFYGEDDDAGTPVKVRFHWDRLGPDTARWEQSFSYDGGPWEPNWVMDFTRARVTAR